MTGEFPRDADPGEAPLLSRWQGRTGCPAPELILPALEGTLPEPARGAVRAHVAACALCSELAEALAEPATPFGSDAGRIAARVWRATRPRLRYAWVPLAAAAAIVLVAAGAYLLTERDRIPAPPVHAATLPPRAEPQRAAVLALAAPAIELPPESLTLRSEGRSSYAAALERGLELFKDGNYAAAAARLERVTRANPSRLHAQFYLGASLLMRGDAVAAVRPLTRARELAGPDSSLYPEATWYLAVALERSGRGKEALDPLVELCGAGGPRGEQACEGLSRLLNTR